MSYYANIKGEFKFKKQEDFDKFLKNKELKPWMEDFEIDSSTREVKINYDSYRNLGYKLGEFVGSGMEGMIVWTSTDGMFEGGVVTNEEESTHDLNEWASEHYDVPEPEDDEEDEEKKAAHEEWVTDLMTAFMDHYFNS